MKRPFANKRLIGPFAQTSQGHQDIVVVVENFNGVPSVVRAVADSITNNTGLAVEEDEINASVNSQGDIVLTIHTGGPDVTHNDVMAVEQIIESESGQPVKSTIVRCS